MTRSAFRFLPLTTENFADLETLFGPKGACGGCWCMAWRRSRREYEQGKGDGNHEALRALVDAGEPVGLLAYEHDRPVGWISVAPREQFDYLRRSRTLQPPDAQPVWSVTCFFIHKEHRGRGLGSALLKAAADWVASRGGRILEGYPTVPRTTALPPVFVWTGLPAMFDRAGFLDCEGGGRGRRLVRLAVSDQSH